MDKKMALEDFDLAGEIDDLLKRTKRILDEAEAKKRYGLALNAIKEVRGTLELLSRTAFSLHSAKLAELELELERSGANDFQREQELNERLKCLTVAELKMVKRLSEKMAAGDPKIIVIPDEPEHWPKLSRRPAKEPTPQAVPEPSVEEPEPEAEDLAPEPEPGAAPTPIRTRPPQPKRQVRDLLAREDTIPGGRGCRVARHRIAQHILDRPRD